MVDVLFRSSPTGNVGDTALGVADAEKAAASFPMIVVLGGDGRCPVDDADLKIGQEERVSVLN
jgi:hypothetical protein